MATYGGYKIVMTKGDGLWLDMASELEHKVSELMMEGWQPYFGLMVLGARLAQVMLWEGEEGEDDTPA